MKLVGSAFVVAVGFIGFCSVASAQCKGNTTTTVALTSTSHPVAVSQPKEEKDIVVTAAGSDQFKTLVAAVKAAGLAEALQGDGPFTVFAPTDAAFAKLPEGTVASLLKPENKDKLVAILKFHVVSGKVMSKDILSVAKAKTLQGSDISVGLTVNGANVIKTDIGCTNGVIHVIDTVILPKE